MFLSANSRVTGGVAARRAFPAGTQLMFVNAAAPVGWVRVTSFDDSLLRIVGSALPGNGGGNGFVATFNAQAATGSSTTSGTSDATTSTGTVGNTASTGTVGNTTITTATMPSHTHPLNGVIRAFAGNDNASAANDSFNGLDNTLSVGSDGAHTHGLTMNAHNHGLTMNAHTHTWTNQGAHTHTIITSIKYVDALIAKKS